MQDAAMFRAYADECRRLAHRMPEHKAALMQMAEAWMACAEDAERKRRKEASDPQ